MALITFASILGPDQAWQNVQTCQSFCCLHTKFRCRLRDRNLDLLVMPAWAFNPFLHENSFTPGRIAQSVMCLTANPGSGVRSGLGPILSLRSFSSLPLVVSYKPKYVHEVLVNCLVKLAQKKKSVVTRHDHSCWLGRKESNQTKNHEYSC